MIKGQYKLLESLPKGKSLNDYDEEVAPPHGHGIPFLATEEFANKIMIANGGLVRYKIPEGRMWINFQASVRQFLRRRGFDVQLSTDGEMAYGKVKENKG